jgi:serine/threonine protein kinase
MIGTDFLGTITSCTEQCRALFGLPPATLAGKKVEDLFQCGDSPLDQDRTGKAWPAVIKCADGSSLPVVCERNAMVEGIRYRITNAQRKIPHGGQFSSSDSGRDEDSSGDCDLELDPLSSSLGFYELQGVLGVGAFGQVKLGRHKITGMPVAIKVVTKSTLDQYGLPFPPQEARILQSLAPHPNVVKLYEAIEYPTHVVLVQEYIGGGELFDLCNAALPEDVARSLFGQLLSGVAWLHRAGVVHRDIKLENCLLSKDGVLKLIDLGLGTFYQVSQGTLLNHFCGSIDYAAPEVYMRALYNGCAVDIWACGVILYVMLTGFLPFSTPQEAVDCKLRYPQSPTVSPHGRSMMGSMMQFDASKRPSAARLLEHPFMRSKFAEPGKGIFAPTAPPNSLMMKKSLI